MGVVMNTLSRKVRKQTKRLGVRYRSFFMQANVSQLGKLSALYESGQLRHHMNRQNCGLSADGPSARV